MMFGKRPYLGFWLEGAKLEAAVVMPVRNGFKTLGQSVVEQDGLLGSEEGRRASLGRAFLGCVKRLPRVARRADTPVVLALPDACVEEEVFKFAEFPKAKEEARSLVCHRMARETGDLPVDLAVSWDVLERAETHVSCRVRAMNASLRADIEGAAAKAGLRLARIDGWAGYACAEPALQSQPSGAAVWSDGRHWSLICWSDADPAGYCQTAPVTEPHSSAADIVRLSISYARANEIGAGPLSADVPQELAGALALAAQAASLGTEVMNTEPRAVQVAKWA